MKFPTYEDKDSTNLAEVGTDCISREQAIEGKICIQRSNGVEIYDDYVVPVKYLEQLPPAQPEQLEQCPIYGGMCAYPSDQCYDCPRHAGAKMGGDNMTDAISRERAIEIVQNRCKRYTTACVLAVTEIRNLPPIRPKRGKWIEDKGQQTLMQNFIEKGEVWRVCSVCGAGHMIGHKYECDKAYHETHHNFCPNCGADMGGEQDG